MRRPLPEDLVGRLQRPGRGASPGAVGFRARRGSELLARIEVPARSLLPAPNPRYRRQPARRVRRRVIPAPDSGGIRTEGRLAPSADAGIQYRQVCPEKLSRRTQRIDAQDCALPENTRVENDVSGAAI